MKTKQKNNRKRRRKQSRVLNLVLIVSMIVFCVSGYQLFRIGKGYMDGRGEYDKVRDIAIKDRKEEKGFRVDFDKLMKINDDTIGWIRFYPEPKEINYPIVQGEDNNVYLHKTFSDNENTLGAIFG